MRESYVLKLGVLCTKTMSPDTPDSQSKYLGLSPIIINYFINMEHITKKMCIFAICLVPTSP